MKGIVVVHVDALERVPVMGTVATSFSKAGFRVVALISSVAALRAWQASRFREVQSVPLARGNGCAELSEEACRVAAKVPISDVLEVHRGYLSSPEAARWAVVTTAIVLGLCKDERGQVVLIDWNGYGLVGRCFRTLAQQRGWITAFLEVGNIGRTLFVDAKGTGQEAAIAVKPSLMRLIGSGDVSDWEDWKNEFIARLRKGGKPPQARSALRHLVRAVYARVASGGTFPRRYRAGELKGLVRSLLCQGNYKKAVAAAARRGEQESVVLAVMQVADDANNIFSPGIAQLEVLNRAADIAKKKRARVRVRIHPAEYDKAWLNLVWEVTRTYGGEVSGYSLYEDLADAQVVVTANSSVGLIARLMGIDVVWTAPSLYERFTDEDVARYVTAWLLPVDPWSGSTNREILIWKDILDRVTVTTVG